MVCTYLLAMPSKIGTTINKTFYNPQELYKPTTTKEQGFTTKGVGIGKELKKNKKG
jgi:hypothetical protein